MSGYELENLGCGLDLLYPQLLLFQTLDLRLGV